MKSSLKPFIEFGPLAVFFYYFIKTGEIQSAILPLMIAAGIAIILSLIFEKKVPPMLLFSTILIFIFGSLTIYFNDPFFIKFKVTVVNLIFAVMLFGGLYFKKPLLKSLMGSSIKLTSSGWMKLSRRWAYFFLFLAVCNEVVYRNFSDSVWVNFKLFGIMGLTFIFILSQVFFIQKNLSDQ
jgi:intracellular septation protein|tara:strand:- start:90 stop:632 length:543 start_codon:yes stop_codon:yes gene_type:complete